MADLTRALQQKVLIAGKIKALTGLHVGGSDTGLAIGGADKLIVRDARSKLPYIPGSSLKGKMRSLLERSECALQGCPGFKVDTKNGKLELRVCSCPGGEQGFCTVCVVFGVSADKSREAKEGKPYAGAARLFVRDAVMTETTKKRMDQEKWQLDMPYTEVKTEVSIDRLTSVANPRQFERVPAGAEFSFEMVLDVYAGDPVDEHLSLVKQGLALVADDALGGQGSRGYGQVEIVLERLAKVPIEAYRDPSKLEAARNGGKVENLRFGRRVGEAA